MKSRLSALKFVRNNKKQVWVMIIALSLTFMTMYIINFLFLTTKESFKALFLEQPKRVAYLDITPDTMGAKLIEGRMPEGDGEILVDEKVLKNKSMKVGGYFNEQFFGHAFKVVGTLESDYMTCVGTPRGYTNTGWYIVVLCDGANSDMTEVLADVGITPTEYDTIFDSVDWAKMYKELVTEQLDAALLAILIVVIIFLAISILVAYVSFMRSRVNEYCLYASIGFGRKDIYGMIMREILIIFGVSMLLSLAVTVIIMVYFAKFMLEPMGLIYQYFYPEHLLRILAAFVVIIGFLQIPVSVTVNRIKTIDMIEE